MKQATSRLIRGVMAGVLVWVGIPLLASAKGYSSSGHSYSSSSSSHSYSSGSHSFGSSSHSFGSSKSFSSGSHHSYSSGSISGGSSGHSYTSGKSYGASGGFAVDRSASRARSQEISKRDFSSFKSSGTPSAPAQAPPVIPNRGSYRSTPPPLPTTYGRSSRTIYIPDRVTILTRPTRIYSVFNPYYTRPYVVYHDPYSSFFWWWLLDRSLDDRAWWAYHHRYDMDPDRYQALVQSDQQLQARVAQLEAQQTPRDPNYTPTGLQQDLMYSDDHVQHLYSNRPTRSARVAFWLLGVPAAVGLAGLFIWLIWFKRWQTA